MGRHTRERSQRNTEPLNGGIAHDAGELESFLAAPILTTSPLSAPASFSMVAAGDDACSRIETAPGTLSPSPRWVQFVSRRGFRARGLPPRSIVLSSSGDLHPAPLPRAPA